MWGSDRCSGTDTDTETDADQDTNAHTNRYKHRRTPRHTHQSTGWESLRQWMMFHVQTIQHCPDAPG